MPAQPTNIYPAHPALPKNKQIIEIPIPFGKKKKLQNQLQKGRKRTSHPGQLTCGT
jgi:hypothetical protein